MTEPTKDDEECALCGHVRKEHTQAMFRNAVGMNYGIRWTARLPDKISPYVLCRGFERRGGRRRRDDRGRAEEGIVASPPPARVSPSKKGKRVGVRA